MTTIEETGDHLGNLLRKTRADYIEARLEESRASHISYRGKELESIGRSTSVGGNVRALVRGAWGFVSFNDLSGLAERVEQAVKQAEFAGTGKSELAPVPPAVDTVVTAPQGNPVDIPLARKKDLMDEYNGIVWSAAGIQTSVASYGDAHRKVMFVSSEGSRILQERTDIVLRVSVIAAKDGDIQQVGLSAGNDGDFAGIQGYHGQIQETARNAVALLSAPRVKGGEYTVVLDPILAGVFAHEAFGHLSESDFVYENPRMREIMTLGKQFGTAGLNIVDGAAVPGFRGSYRYDDEGVPATKTYLIREGRLVGRLHSRETAARMGEKPTGNARAISYRFPPIVRMTNTIIEPGKASFDDIVGEIKEGVYAKNWYGGTTSMEMFTFSAGEAYMIRNGKVAEMVRPVVLTGNVFKTLHNIDAFGNDLDMNQGGGCGKAGQMPLPVSNGSPHIRIRHCLVGGA